LWRPFRGGLGRQWNPRIVARGSVRLAIESRDFTGGASAGAVLGRGYRRWVTVDLRNRFGSRCARPGGIDGRRRFIRFTALRLVCRSFSRRVWGGTAIEARSERGFLNEHTDMIFDRRCSLVGKRSDRGGCVPDFVYEILVGEDRSMSEQPLRARVVEPGDRCRKPGKFSPQFGIRVDWTEESLCVLQRLSQVSGVVRARHIIVVHRMLGQAANCRGQSRVLFFDEGGGALEAGDELGERVSVSGGIVQ